MPPGARRAPRALHDGSDTSHLGTNDRQGVLEGVQHWFARRRFRQLRRGYVTTRPRLVCVRARQHPCPNTISNTLRQGGGWWPDPGWLIQVE